VIVLDTHTWLWYATESEKLSKQAKARIKRAETLGVHPISCLELAMLSNSGRIKLSMDTTRWIGHALERPKVELLPFTPAAAIRAAGLGDSFPEIRPIGSSSERHWRWGCLWSPGISALRSGVTSTRFGSQQEGNRHCPPQITEGSASGTSSRQGRLNRSTRHSDPACQVRCRTRIRRPNGVQW